MARLGRRESVRLLEVAHESGITHFDTARAYGYGEAESAVGDFLAGRRDAVTVTTKVGLLPPRNSRGLRAAKAVARAAVSRAPALRARLRSRAEAMVVTGHFEPGAARLSLETSLRELRTEAVDVLLLHECRPADLETEGLLGFLQDVVREGKVRCFGLGTDRDSTRTILRERPAFARVAQVPRSALDGPLVEGDPVTGTAVITHSAVRTLLEPLREAMRSERRRRALVARAGRRLHRSRGARAAAARRGTGIRRRRGRAVLLDQRGAHPRQRGARQRRRALRGAGRRVRPPRARGAGDRGHFPIGRPYSPAMPADEAPVASPAVPPGPVRRLLGRGLVRAGLITYVFAALTLVANLVSGIVSARALGPDGRGVTVALSAVAQLAGFLFAMGVAQSLSYFIARRPQDGPRLFTTWLLMLLPLTAIAIVVAELLLTTIFAVDGEQAIDAGRWFLFTIVVVVGLELNFGLLLGAHDFLFYNAVRLAQPALAAASFVVLLVAGRAHRRELAHRRDGGHRARARRRDGRAPCARSASGRPTCASGCTRCGTACAGRA